MTAPTDPRERDINEEMMDCYQFGTVPTDPRVQPGERQPRVSLAACPIGLFLADSGELCLKTEYGNNEGRIDAYIVSSGEFFWGAAPQTITSQRAQMVQPFDARATIAAQAVEIARLTAERDDAREERDARADFMRRQGYRSCNTPACNCNSWHGGNAADRLSEIRDVIDGEGGFNGVATLDAIQRLFTRTEAAEARVAELESTDAARDVLAERRRQVDAEGWTPEHDDAHRGSEMSRAAACYALHPCVTTHRVDLAERLWPWQRKWWQPRDQRRNLVKAGALILAEIERLDRAARLVSGEAKDAPSPAEGERDE